MGKHILPQDLFQLTVMDLEAGRVTECLHIEMCKRIAKNYPKATFIIEYIEKLENKNK